MVLTKNGESGGHPAPTARHAGSQLPTCAVGTDSYLGGLIPLAQDLSDTLMGQPSRARNLSETVSLADGLDDAVAERAPSPLGGGSPATNPGERGGLAIVTGSS